MEGWRGLLHRAPTQEGKPGQREEGQLPQPGRRPCTWSLKHQGRCLWERDFSWALKESRLLLG